jgi:hypothetical protein
MSIEQGGGSRRQETHSAEIPVRPHAAEERAQPAVRQVENTTTSHVVESSFAKLPLFAGFRALAFQVSIGSVTDLRRLAEALHILSERQQLLSARRHWP